MKKEMKNSVLLNNEFNSNYLDSQLSLRDTILPNRSVNILDFHKSDYSQLNLTTVKSFKHKNAQKPLKNTTFVGRGDNLEVIAF